jgi:hypothetical protein
LESHGLRALNRIHNHWRDQFYARAGRTNNFLLHHRRPDDQNSHAPSKVLAMEHELHIWDLAIKVLLAIAQAESEAEHDDDDP